jgi:hypothetical protein
MMLQRSKFLTHSSSKLLPMEFTAETTIKHFVSSFLPSLMMLQPLWIKQRDFDTNTPSHHMVTCEETFHTTINQSLGILGLGQSWFHHFAILFEHRWGGCGCMVVNSIVCMSTICFSVISPSLTISFKCSIFSSSRSSTLISSKTCHLALVLYYQCQGSHFSQDFSLSTCTLLYCSQVTI